MSEDNQQLQEALEGFRVKQIKQEDLKQAVAAFELKQSRRSFSERNPHLKKFKCAVCGRRHPKQAFDCQQQFAVNPKTKEVMIAPATKKSIQKAVERNRYRTHPHDRTKP